MEQHESDSIGDHSGSERPSAVAWLVGPAFLLMAGWFLWLAPPAEVPPSGTPPFDASALAVVLRPAVSSDPPLTRVGAYEYRCTDCHRVFSNETEKIGGLVQHTHIVFNHGLNNRCFNCHDRLDRNKLVGRDGGYISYTEVPTLCSQCHGTTYRDWERGMHGKALGSWEPGGEGRVQLTCVQCHDPHAPAFPSYVPLPAPNTLRMGDQPSEPHHDRPSPLAMPFEHDGGHGGLDAGHGGDYDADTHAEPPTEVHEEEGGADG